MTIMRLQATLLSVCTSISTAGYRYLSNYSECDCGLLLHQDYIDVELYALVFTLLLVMIETTGWCQCHCTATCDNSTKSGQIFI